MKNQMVLYNGNYYQSLAIKKVTSGFLHLIIYKNKKKWILIKLKNTWNEFLAR